MTGKVNYQLTLGEGSLEQQVSVDAAGIGRVDRGDAAIRQAHLDRHVARLCRRPMSPLSGSSSLDDIELADLALVRRMGYPRRHLRAEQWRASSRSTIKQFDEAIGSDFDFTRDRLRAVQRLSRPGSDATRSPGVVACRARDGRCAVLRDALARLAAATSAATRRGTYVGRYAARSPGGMAFADDAALGAWWPSAESHRSPIAKANSSPAIPCPRADVGVSLSRGRQVQGQRARGHGLGPRRQAPSRFRSARRSDARLRQSTQSWASRCRTRASHAWNLLPA